MEFGASTILLFLFISPALLLYWGVRVNSAIDIKLDVTSQAIQFLFLLIVSSILNIFLLPLYIFLIQSCSLLYVGGAQVFGFFAPYDFALSDFYTRVDISAFDPKIYDFKKWFCHFWYIPFSYLLSFLLGRLIIAKVESGKWPIRIFHGIMYPYVLNHNTHDIFCSIATNTVVDDYVLMYKGRLGEISFANRNQIDVISLKEPQRYLMKMDRLTNKSKVFNHTKVSYFAHAIAAPTEENLIIKGDQIANVLFTNLRKLASAAPTTPSSSPALPPQARQGRRSP